jgi:hypothetical protein
MQYSSTGLPQSFLSHVEAMGRKRISHENVEAIRARFLEMFIHKPPKQLPSDLEKCGTFERPHFILGAFDKALSLLETYQVNDFHSLFLPAYVLSGLIKNLPLMEQVFCQDSCSAHHAQRIQHLVSKFNLPGHSFE